jgi:hypothetical protein
MGPDWSAGSSLLPQFAAAGHATAMYATDVATLEVDVGNWFQQLTGG